MAAAPRGLFEVHLIARVMSDLDGALAKVPASAARPRLGEARTHYGLHPSQPMVTYWMSSQSGEEVVASAKATAAAIGTIVRIKVEGIPSNPGTPLERLPSDCYWEIHGKIVGGDWAQAAAVCAPFGVHLFWNGTKEGKTPITNLRRYTGSFAAALADQTKLLDALVAEGMELREVHHECGIYDSAPELDEGWLYPVGGDKADFLKSVPVY
jgi:hypothetical protein